MARPHIYNITAITDGFICPYSFIILSISAPGVIHNFERKHRFCYVNIFYYRTESNNSLFSNCKTCLLP